ncbi:MFS transporter, PPP family, 3-phenylpropionic acid transporter [Faunimonas pinastri]|uniref:MFS transporter, PPP family, 3-phenylpropionic acid transporter n=1 Tax=Faunimonas pinastri TaxID=1855383 RepID=A0A1H9FDV6_9HYPH|nr:MFS transporter [Faunimonas pinastri]SEQ35508.1 MFS transporter, PPP family, 3-phenylpropionic acid transporter [Faunimonas pinastri]
MKQSGSGTDFAIRASAFCAVVFFASGIIYPFLPVWLAARGLADTELAAVLAAPLFLRPILTAPLAALTDRFRNLAHAAAAFAFAAGIAFACLGAVHGFWPTLVLTALAIMLWNFLIPLSDAVNLVGVRDHGLVYARLRIWGSFAFIVASLITAAAIRLIALPGVFLLLTATFLIGGVISLAVPEVGPSLPSRDGIGWRTAFSEPVIRRAFLGASCTVGSHGAYYTFASLYWHSIGFSAFSIAAMWAVSVTAELLVLWVVGRIPQPGARRCLVAGALVAVLRWAFFPFAVAPGAALLLQALHAITFAFNHIGVMRAIGSVSAPGHTARLQALYQLTSGLVLAVATLAAGPLYRLSPAYAFSVMALLAGAGLFFSFPLERGLHPQRDVPGGETIAPS